jgi:hypothetical protein
VRFEDETSRGGGGVSHGIVAIANSVAKIAYSSFSQNTQAGIGAGAIFCQRSTVSVSHTTMSENKNVGLGAASIYAMNSSHVAVTSSRFTYNEVKASSGRTEVDPVSGQTIKRATGIVCDGSVFRVLYSHFAYNRGAAAIAATASCDMQISHSTISDHGHNLVDGVHTLSTAVTIDAGSVVTIANTEMRGNVGAEAGAVLVTGVGTVATITETIVHDCSASSSTQAVGAVLVQSGALLNAIGLTLTANFADSSLIEGASSIAAGAMLVDEASLVLSHSTFQRNRIKASLAGKGSAGLYASYSTIDVEFSHLDFNDAVNEITGMHYGPTFTTGMHALNSETIRAFETTFLPFDDGESVIVSPGSFRGKLRGGCLEHPCLPGFGCQHANYSLSCHGCSDVTYSHDGINCIACPQGNGPNEDLTGCTGCTGNNHSTFGVCLPCPTELVVDSDKINCDACGVHRTAVSVGTPDVPRVCGCDDGYYNGSIVVQACFVGGYDASMHQKVIQDHYMALASTKQHCEACPTDVTDVGCVVCRDGKPPAVAAGYTVPQIAPDSGRRMLLEDGDLEIALVYRCHIELPLARARCPEGANPGECNFGYEGYLCDSCIEGYGMSPARTCEPCEGTGFTGQSLVLLMGIIGGVAFVLWVISKLWKAFPLKHLARCAFQPGASSTAS